MKTLIWIALQKIRLHVYKAGMRPKPGSLLYSPSLDFIYGFKELDPLRAMQEKINESLTRQNAAQTAWALQHKQKED
jgi:hypothetical protein